MLLLKIIKTITKIKTTIHPIENHQLVYKLYDLIPEEIKIVEEFNEGK